jgi:hypothetical protein
VSVGLTQEALCPARTASRGQSVPAAGGYQGPDRLRGSDRRKDTGTALIGAQQFPAAARARSAREIHNATQCVNGFGSLDVS